MAAGIYRATSFAFNPVGRAGCLTTFRAADGARVILTGLNDETVSSTTPDYFRVQGLWFGGKFAAGSSATPQFTGIGKEVIDCTFFGFWQGPLFGWTQNALFQGNRLIGNGGNLHFHSTYFCSGAAGSGQFSNHILVDKNIVIGGFGYGLQAWHSASNLIFSRNFVSGSEWGGISDGDSNLWLNNLYVNMTGTDYGGQPPTNPDNIWGYYTQDTHSVIENSVFLHNGWLLNNNNPTAHVGYNAFATDGMSSYVLIQPSGVPKTLLVPGNEANEIGISVPTIITLTAQIEVAFTISAKRPIAALYTDPSIDGLFAPIELAQVPANSRLHGAGYPYDGASVDIGWNVAAPVDWWSVFKRYAALYSLKSYDNQGGIVQ